MKQLINVDKLGDPPVLPEGGHLEELNDSFLLGKIAALFCSLRYDATHNTYNDAAILKLAITNPARFLKQVGGDALKYARILGPGRRSKKFQEISGIVDKLSEDIYEPTRLNQQKEACVVLGFFKQNEYLLKAALIRQQKEYNHLVQKDNLTDKEQSKLNRLIDKFFPENI